MDENELSGSFPELNESADSFTAQDGNTESSTVNDANADSSPASNEDDSLLSVVRSVSDAADKAVDNSDDDGEQSNSQADPTEGVDGQTAKGEPDEDDFSDAPFSQHKRFKQLLQSRNTYRSKVAELEPDATQYRQIHAFMERSQLTPEEVAEGLILMAEMKSGDPSKAYAALSKKLEALALASGEKLPDELEERVQQGYVDRETAQQMYRDQQRLAREAATSRSELERRTQAEAASSAQAVQAAVASWEAQTRTSDPDYAIKADLVKDRLRARIAANGVPRTPEAAVELAKAAYQEVSEKLNKVRGQKPPMRQPVGGKVSGSVAPQPRNLLEVIKRTTG